MSRIRQFWKCVSSWMDRLCFVYSTEHGTEPRERHNLLTDDCPPLTKDEVENSGGVSSVTFIIDAELSSSFPVDPESRSAATSYFAATDPLDLPFLEDTRANNGNP